MKRKLSSFHGDKKVQLSVVDKVYKWLDVQMRQKSAREIAETIMATRRVIKPSDCVLENEELFTKELDLPAWLFRLMITINHNFSNGFDGLKPTYESKYYERFLFACNVGVDYTLMFHQWEAFVLGEYLPDSVLDESNIKRAVELHEKALHGHEIPRQEWLALHGAVEKTLNTLNDHDSDRKMELLWTANRTVFLSVEEVINPDEHWTSSIDAAVDARYLDVLIGTLEKGNDQKKLRDFKKLLWRDILDDLEDMVRNWK